MLLRVSANLLVLRDSNLAWVDPSGATAVADGEHELLRGLWRGDLIRLPEGTESDRVTLTLSGHRVVQELRVFGEPPVSTVSAGRSVMDTTTTADRGRPSLAERVAAAVEAALGDYILFPRPVVRDGDTTRILIQLTHRHTADDVVRARRAIARHLGVPEVQMTIRPVSDTGCVELTLRDGDW